MFTSIVLLLTARFALGKIGGPCNYNGLAGTCKSTSDCDSAVAGFTVKGYCPDDPANVKCCLTKACTGQSGQAGFCLNNPGSSCSGTFDSNRCPGPNDVQCCISEAPPSTPSEPEETSELVVSFWIKSSIPLNVEDVTHPWPNHPGKTMLNGLPQALEWVPNFGGCFVTDQRSYSSVRGASARMHSEVRVEMSGSAYDWSQTHRCGQTVKVDCDDGAEKDQATAGTGDMSFSLKTSTPKKVVLGYSGLASDPLVTGAPKIDIVGTLTINRSNGYVEFAGKVDDFPAFEAYVLIDGSGPYTVATLGPEEGSSAFSLVGGANRAFKGRVLLD